ncbi:MAG: Eco57I restriction-modification methylase domain-containing protein [Bellilinea sp.]
MTDQESSTSIITAPPEIIALVDRFDGQRAAYRSGHYNETQLRRDFLDPFFEALGWDLTNRKNYSEKFREVIHERSVEVEGQAKAADYAFQSGGNTLFFLEAKKPAVNIETNPDPAFQIRRYAWSAKIPISILSDFEQLAVYDCRAKPVHGNAAHIGRVKLFSYAEYVSKWDELYRLFSYQAVHQGSLDQFAVGLKGKRGTADVDDAFLVEMERWREELARNFALRNPALTTRQLNSAVQLTIDRIIFLRICEERGIEAEDALRDATDGKEVYSDLLALFRQADKKYNSGLFHFSAEKGQSSHPDTLTPTLKIDDKVLKDILANLYYPKSPYAFKYIPADILGQVYERFLGKVIRLTAAHQAKVEEKPEVRKAGGVYYTPTYIVEYIVKNTVGELLKDKDPEALKHAPLRVLDPACGSGSFLLGAYQYLLDWYLDWYVQHDPAKWGRGKNPPIFEIRDGSWQLTMEKKKEILTSHIYGVDIDAQAVEVTKLSLLLKVVENPGQLGLLTERILPDLGENIQCGNSLIGPDYYDGQQLGMFDSEEQYRVNAFDWKAAFPQVFRDGGFDAVIGNPPYVRQETLGEQKNYFRKHYQAYHGIADLYVYFIERGVKLLRQNGLFSYIVANKWMRTNYGAPLRNWLKTQHIEEIVDFGDLPVFEQATTYPCILRVRSKENPNSIIKAIQVKSLDFHNLSEYIATNAYPIASATLHSNGWSLADSYTSALLDKFHSIGKPLGEYVNDKIFYGLKTGLNEAFVVDDLTRAKLIDKDPKSEMLIKPFLIGREVKSYQPPLSKQYLILIPKGWTRQASKNAANAWKWMQNNYPAIANHLAPFAIPAEKRYDKGEHWWELRACDYYDEFEKSKIIYPNICKKPEFTYDVSGLFTNQKCFIIPTLDKYLLGILNSSVSFYLFRKLLPKLRGDFYEPSYVYFKEFPIRTVDFTNPADVKRHDRMVSLVENMLALHKQSNAARLPDEKERLQRQIQATDRQIDTLVYELYGLTAEEIKIVEG